MSKANKPEKPEMELGQSSELRRIFDILARQDNAVRQLSNRVNETNLLAFRLERHVSRSHYGAVPILFDGETLLAIPSESDDE